MGFFTTGHGSGFCNDGQPGQVILGGSCYDTLEAGRNEGEAENIEGQEYICYKEVFLTNGFISTDV